MHNDSSGTTSRARPLNTQYLTSINMAFLPDFIHPQPSEGTADTICFLATRLLAEYGDKLNEEQITLLTNILVTGQLSVPSYVINKLHLSLSFPLWATHLVDALYLLAPADYERKGYAGCTSSPSRISWTVDAEKLLAAAFDSLNP